MPRPSVHTVVVMGEALSLPLAFSTVRAFKDAGHLPSTVIRADKPLVDEVVAVDTLLTVARLCGRPGVTEDALVASARMSELRKEATGAHIALVMMFGPEGTPVPKEEPPPPPAE